MPTTWTINNQTFAASALSNVIRQRYNMATDRMTFEAPSRAIDAAPLFAYDAPVTVLRDNEPFFKGRAGRAPVSGSPASESHSYEVLGPWDQLERLTYQQAWTSGSWQADPDDPDGDPVWVPRTEYKSRVIIGQDSAGQPQTVAAVIAEVIDYAEECGVSITAGSIQGNTTPPWDEIVDMSCAEVIRRVARWIPSAVGWVDYSVQNPTFNFCPRSGLPSVLLTVGSVLSEVQLTRMGSRSVPAVVIKYEQINTVNGAQMTSMTTDAFPLTATGREIGAVLQTIQLGGGSLDQSRQRQDIRSLALPSMLPPNNAVLLAWFLSKHPGYNDPKYGNLVITAAVRDKTLPLELIEGSLQDWMRKDLPTYNVIGNPVWVSNPHHTYSYSDREDTIKITIAYTMLSPTGVPLRAVADEVITTKVTVTDCPTDRYSRLTSDSSAAEPIPQGLAAALYADLNATHYQGTIKLIEEEIYGTISIGSLLYIQGGDPAWSSMSACIQSISEHLDSGTSSIQVGPPSHLTPSDILDLRRANRARKPAVNASSRASGEASGNTVDIGSAQPKSIHGYTPGRWGVTLTVITGHRFNSATNCLQIKTRPVVVNYAGAESDWADVEGGCAEDCDEYP